MRPPFSVIFFTTLAGAGQGLFLALYVVDPGAALAGDARFFSAGGLLAAALAALGLFASFFHLGRVRPAWRAASQWRTSWLSREVIVLPAFIAGALLYAAARHFAWPAAVLIGHLTLVACLALFVCTAMIYVCIRFLQEWASPLTIANFFLLGAASGFTLAVPLAAALAPQLTRFYAAGSILLTMVALVARSASLIRNARLKPKSSLQSAIGIQHPRIAQMAQGFMGGSYNTREFFHGASRAALRAVKWGFLLLAFPVPVLLLAAGLALGALPLLAAAFAAQYAGLVAERWFFFAQANHPQNLYYQAIS